MAFVDDLARFYCISTDCFVCWNLSKRITRYDIDSEFNIPLNYYFLEYSLNNTVIYIENIYHFRTELI